MLSLDEILDSTEWRTDPRPIVEAANQFFSDGDIESAASAFDCAHALKPNDTQLAEVRRQILDQLAVQELGIHFRYIPAGSFLMGSNVGDLDEDPIHPVRLDPFWISDVPISWATFCRLMNWEPPPNGMPRKPNAIGQTSQATQFDEREFKLHNIRKIRLQYCEDETNRAIDWHSHALHAEPQRFDSDKTKMMNHFKPPERLNIDAPIGYSSKPMIAVSWQEAEELCKAISDSTIEFRLPSEAEWEKSARGGLVGRKFSWGDDEPTQDLCDFNNFDRFRIRPSRSVPPNGYGIYAPCGGVWEWTGDLYDQNFYSESPIRNPCGPKLGVERVLRGGSWSDCASSVTVSFRMSLPSRHWNEAGYGGQKWTPNVGFRLVRRRRDTAATKTNG